MKNRVSGSISFFLLMTLVGYSEYIENMKTKKMSITIKEN